ncbi:CRISPR-associated helicase Cas3' [Magnetococcales bacterium HHB-1]
MKKTKYAHSANAVKQWHPLKTHLLSVARLSRQFGEAGDFSEEAYLAGLLHDLGKYGERFQKRLRGEGRRVNHWSSGALVAAKHFNSPAVGMAIESHHLGLSRLSMDLFMTLNQEDGEVLDKNQRYYSDKDADTLLSLLKEDGVTLPEPLKVSGDPFNPALARMLEVRMIFSALTDADFLDTEAHFKGDDKGKKMRHKGEALQAERALEILLKHIDLLGERSQAPESVLKARKTLLKNCLDAGERSPGLWTMTAPTGAGKTLSMLAFALKQAVCHDLRRVVIVIPYLSIIEQTAAILRKIFEPHFGPDYILEHHSLIGGVNPGEERSHQKEWLCENWDAPLIITTNVQFLHSLFASKSSKCRKLHRLPRSVILLDEVQTLTIGLALPTLGVLSHLSYHFNSSVVFSTATQPAFDHLDSAVRKVLSTSGWQPKEIVSAPDKMFQQLERVQVVWPKEGETITLSSLAVKIAKMNQVLVIVNLKRHAKMLFEILLQELDSADIFHLSTALCPRHRSEVLSEVHQRLASGKKCRLVATQCVEAGVDIDFPAVFRAFAPLESLAQAAGRCNREGKMSFGEMTVFQLPKAEDGYPPEYERGIAVCRYLLKNSPDYCLDLNNPLLYHQYYISCFNLADAEDSQGVLWEAIKTRDFSAVSKHYRLIREDSISVVVPYDTDLFDKHIALLGESIDWRWFRSIQPLVVSLYPPQRGDAIFSYLIPIEQKEGWYYLNDAQLYDDHLGFINPEQMDLWIA